MGFGCFLFCLVCFGFFLGRGDFVGLSLGGCGWGFLFVFNFLKFIICLRIILFFSVNIVV